MRRACVFAIVSAVASVAAAAPTKSECVDANTQAQELRKNESFKAAREALRTCSNAACPKIVRADCESRLEEIERLMPSVVFEASDASGKPAPATVTMDGTALGPVGGPAVEVDPGEHKLVFQMPGRPAIMRVVAIDEGDKTRHVSVTFEDPAQLPSPSRGAPFRVAGIVLTSAAIASILAGTAFGIATFTTWGGVRTECPSAAVCDPNAPSDRARAISFATTSDIAFAVGGALAVAGVSLFVMGVRLAPQTGPRVIGLTLTETF